MALKSDAIDPTSFTLLRILSGAAFLAALVFVTQRTSEAIKKPPISSGNWPSAIALFTYAAGFSFAYITMDTGAGALVLFGFVQLTMILISLYKGTRLSLGEWSGGFMAFAGLAYMLAPGADAPSLMSFTLMAAAGVAWGVYTLRGKGSSAPLADTCGNFIRASVAAVGLSAIMLMLPDSDIHLNADGALLALASGILASGAGYAIWYTVLPKLDVSRAAVIQLSVPVIAALGGVIFSGEPITQTFMIASILVLGGILLVIISRNR
ncbi:MAG: DMT family transporter [Thalassolituus sp.]